MRRKLLCLMLLILSVAVILNSCSGEKNDEGKGKENGKTTLSNKSQNSEIGENVFGKFTAKDLEGNEVTENIFSEKKLTMVNVWGTYCGPCISEMPELGEINREYKDKGFQIIGIPVDTVDYWGKSDESAISSAKQLVEQTKADYLHIVPSETMIETKLAAVSSIPETIFIDRNGNQIGESFIGAKSKDSWKEIIDELIKGM